MFKVNYLSKSIQQKTILKDLSFEVDHGKIAIFLGASGVGKSTLLRVLNNLDSYNTGTFTLDGKELNQSDLNLSHTIGMVFQHFNLFENLNTEENITFTLMHCKNLNKNEAQLIATKLLKRYGLQDQAQLAISQLSGGQKQRLAIARTLAVDPKIVCLDEPTSALDPRLTTQVATYIKQLAEEKRIVLLTTHDIHLIEQLDAHLLLMEGGSIVETTPYSEYHNNPNLYPKLQNFLKGT